MDLIKWFVNLHDRNTRKAFEETFDASWEASPDVLKESIINGVYDLIDDYQQAAIELSKIPYWDKNQARTLLAVKDADLRQAIKLARARGFQVVLDENKTYIVCLTRPKN